MKIEFHGDSTQAGAEVWGGKSVQTAISPAQVVQAYLGPEHEVSNFGVGGSTLAQAATGASLYARGSFAQHIAKSDADVIVCNWGINDAYLPGNTSSQHLARWVTIRDIVTAAGKTFYIQTPNPLNVPHKYILAGLVKGTRNIPGVQYIDIHAHMLRYYPLWQHHLSDGIHPNGIMYREIGYLLWNTLREI